MRYQRLYKFARFSENAQWFGALWFSPQGDLCLHAPPRAGLLNARSRATKNLRMKIFHPARKTAPYSALASVTGKTAQRSAGRFHQAVQPKPARIHRSNIGPHRRGRPWHLRYDPWGHDIGHGQRDSQNHHKHKPRPEPAASFPDILKIIQYRFDVVIQMMSCCNILKINGL